jgi:hypothetical protein
MEEHGGWFSESDPEALHFLSYFGIGHDPGSTQIQEPAAFAGTDRDLSSGLLGSVEYSVPKCEERGHPQLNYLPRDRVYPGLFSSLA